MIRRLLLNDFTLLKRYTDQGGDHRLPTERQVHSACRYYRYICALPLSTRKPVTFWRQVILQVPCLAVNVIADVGQRII